MPENQDRILVNRDTPLGSGSRHGAIGTVVTWGLLRILAHNDVVVPPEAIDGAVELISLAAGGAFAGIGALWRWATTRSQPAQPQVLSSVR